MIPHPGGRISRPSPYPSWPLTCADWLSTRLMGTCRFFLDRLFCCFHPVTMEWEHPVQFCLMSAIKGPIYLLAFLFTLPAGVLGMLVYIAIAEKREKFRMSTIETVTEKPHVKKMYGFATINLCGHYELICRINNMTDSHKRLLEIGKIIRSSQSKYMRHAKANGTINDMNGIASDSTGAGDCSTMITDIQTEFPETDVIFFQEVIFPETGAALAEILHGVYPYAVYDACDHGWSKNYMLSGGDVMIVSKYPIINARFHRYDIRCGCDVMCSKGLLQAKLDLGEENGSKLVGFASNTHLQVYPEGEPVHQSQLDDILRWTTDHRDATRTQNEKIVFDVVGGDFNFDNTSPVDKATWDHPIYQVYDDACREGPGKDKPFATGTEVRQPNMYDTGVTTPEGLKEALEDPSRRRWHILDGDLEYINVKSVWDLPPCDPETGKAIVTPQGGKRRIDYLLTRKEDNVKTLASYAVTKLAALTDHIPYSLTIQVQ